MNQILNATFNFSRLSVFIFLGAFSTTAMAEKELTKEGAQAFITQVASRGVMYWGQFSPRGYLNEWTIGWNSRIREEWISYDLGKIDGAKTLDSCKTSFDFKVDESKQYYSSDNEPYTNPLGRSWGNALVIDWSKATTFKLRESDLIVGSVHDGYNNKQIAFKISDEALRKRLVFAFEFLRLNCDTLSKSGF